MRVRQYRYQGYPDKALKALNQAESKYKDNAQFFVERASCFVNLNRFQEAIADCSSAIKLDPNLADAYSNRAYCYATLEKYEPAAKDYTEVLKLDGDDSLIYRNRGLAYRKLGKLKEAAADMKKFKELTANREKHKRDINLLGDTVRMEREGNRSKAIEFMEAQVKAGPSVISYSRLAELYDKNDQQPKALEAAAKAVELARQETGRDRLRDLKAAYMHRADLFSRHKKYTEAAEDYSALININEPESKETATRQSAKHFRAFALGARADCYHKLHQNDKALADVDQALIASPTTPSLLSLRSDLLSEAGKDKEALTDLDKAIATADRNAYRLQRAQINLKIKQYETALKDFTYIVDSDHGFVKEALNGRAEVYRALNKTKEAAADQARAAKLD